MKQTHTTQEAEGRELAKRMRDFVQSRGGPAKDADGKPVGTCWPMMLEAAGKIDALLSRVSVLEKALLRMPHDAWRAQNQDIFVRVLDRVAGFYDDSREEIQNHFEMQVMLEDRAEFQGRRRGVSQSTPASE